ncbi:Ig-like domain-containing protein [Candidatus Sumerlaeota bacterium]|nr:Ig-like domain-containing protein [Candidatus Sumerlaeota bacterium]
MLTLGMSWTYDAAGIPATPDIVPPQIVKTSFIVGTADVQITFSEPVVQPRFPFDIDFQSPQGSHLAPEEIVFDGSTITLRYRGSLPFSGDYRLTVRGFYGVEDLAGNFLDGDGDGIGGDLSDDQEFIFSYQAGDPAGVQSTAWPRYR